MKKEYFLIAAVALFILGYVIDWLAGPIGVSILNPFDFLTQPVISDYPFTGVSIGLKAIFILIITLIPLTYIPEKQVAKGVFLIFLTALFELYSIQQIATGYQMVSMTWSLAFSYSGVLLLIPAVIYIVIGIGRLLHRKITREAYDEVTKDAKDPDI